MDTALDRLAEQFRRLPGIGVKTARKMAYYMVQQPQERVDEFIQAVRDAKAHMTLCSVCFNLSDQTRARFVRIPAVITASSVSSKRHRMYRLSNGAVIIAVSTMSFMGLYRL